MNRGKVQENIRNMAMTAMFAAMIYLLTAFVHIPTHQGYVHVGDGIIYLSAAILPVPYAMAASAIGAGLSDYLSGYAVWVLPTVIIKSLTVLAFTNKNNRIINKRNLFGVIPAGLICVGGYYVSGVLVAIISGSAVSAAFGGAVADILTNTIQSLASGILFVAMGASLDKINIKRMIRV